MRYSCSRTEAWLILLRTPRLGSVRIRALLERYGNIQTCIDALRTQPPAGLPRSALAWLRSPDRMLLDSDLAWIEQADHRLLSYDEEDFPPQLNVCAGAPPVLFVVGDAARLLLPQVAIVGARAASPEGLANAEAFASALAVAGFVVTSGLATGIDAAAHTAALAYQTGTIAVMGTGPDRIYPRHHCKLAARIAETGALVTAFPPGTRARATHFPQRNRVLAGLALGTLVIEAGDRSGALISARASGDFGREVFALPGSIHHSLARGCHRLIRSGAQLVEEPDEVVQSLGDAARFLGIHLSERLQALRGSAVEQPQAPPVQPDDQPLLDALGHTPLALDVLSQRCGLAIPSLSSRLVLLELDGRVARLTGGLWQRLPG